MSDQKDFTNLQNEIDKIAEKWAGDVVESLGRRFKKMVALELGCDPRDDVMVREFSPWYVEKRQNGEEFSSYQHLYHRLLDKKKKQIIAAMLSGSKDK